MFNRRQSELSKLKMMHRASIKQAQNKLIDFTNKIRDEVYTFVFTDLETAFGEQPEAVLVAIDKGLQISLQAEDQRWRSAIALRYDGMVVNTHMSKLMSGQISAEDSQFIRAIRDEVIDLIAQYVTDFLKLEHEVVQGWVTSLISRPSLAPERLVEDARKRLPKVS